MTPAAVVDAPKERISYEDAWRQVCEALRDALAERALAEMLKRSYHS